MARHEQKDGQPQYSFETLKEQSERLAEDYNIPQDRLLACLARIAAAYANDDSRRGDPLRQAVDLLRDAVSALGEEQSIQLLEATDPQRLEHRIRAVEYLCRDSVPFCSLDEVQDQLGKFLEFQDEVKTFLVETGLPPKTFDESPWLFLHLGRLYDTRCTRSPYPRKPSLPTYRKGHNPLQKKEKRRQVDASSLSAKEPYIWVKYPTESEFTLGQIETCEYEDADFLPGLNQEDAKQLEAERPRIWAARRAVIAEVVQACERRDGERLLERCLEILDAKLGRATILFLLRLDSFYLGGDPRTPERVETSPKMSPGGLTNLVEVIGHVEDELKSGKNDILKRSLPKGILDPVFDDDEASESYLKLTRTADAGAVDSALDEFSERAKKSRRHWRDVCHKFAKWLDPDFRVSLHAEVQPEFAEQVALLLPAIIAHMESKIEAGECLMPLSPSSNLFRFFGSFWNIAFEGKLIACPHRVGLFYIAKLLQHPNTDIEAVSLKEWITAWETGGSTTNHETLSRVVVSDGNPDHHSAGVFVSGPGDAGLAADAQTLAACRAKLKMVQKQLASAQKLGQGDDAAELQDELNKLQKYIDDNTDNRGQPRPLKSDRKNAGNAVRKAINEALRDLREVHPTLYNHLENFISRGPTCRYAPPTPVDWEF